MFSFIFLSLNIILFDYFPKKKYDVSNMAR